MTTRRVRTVVNLSSYAELAVRLANTAVQAPDEPDPLGTAAACNSALGDGLQGTITRRDLAVLRYLRSEFAAIFTAGAAGDANTAMTKLNALMVQFPIHPEMVSHDDQRWHVHLAPQGGPADRYAAGAIIGVALTVSQFGVSRLGVCGIAACPRVFIDATKGKSRRYCAEHTARGNVSTLRGQHPGSAGPARPGSQPADAKQAAAHSPAGISQRATPAAS
jgi:predicted RNA-binding Zn ribbon-like protein